MVISKALNKEDALNVLDLYYELFIPVLGGDVLYLKQNGILDYTNDNVALSDSRVYRPTREHHIIYVAVDSREEYLLHKDQLSVKCNGKKKKFSILVDDPTGKTLVKKKSKAISLNKGRNRFQLWFKSRRTTNDSIDIEVVLPPHTGTFLGSFEY